MRPIVNGLEATYQDQIAFQRIDVEAGDGPTIMKAYRISGHPTILLYDAEGQEVSRLFGPQTEEDLTAALQRILVD